MKHSKARSADAIEFARGQRRTANEFASTVWQWIRNRQIDGIKFRREFPIPPYTVDFCSVEQKLVIEIDGEAHFTEEGQRYDEARDQLLRNLGYRVLRIEGYEVIRNDGNAITMIREFVRSNRSIVTPNPSPLPPLPEAGRGGQET
jgi:very-short-patch-repair endonuclease